MTNDRLWVVFESIQLMADRHFRTLVGAAEFRELDEEGQVENFNRYLLPLWQAMGSPDKGGSGFIEFQDAVLETWR